MFGVLLWTVPEKLLHSISENKYITNDLIDNVFFIIIKRLWSIWSKMDVHDLASKQQRSLVVTNVYLGGVC